MSYDSGNSWLQPYAGWDFGFRTYVASADTTPPVLTLPADITVTAWQPSGSYVQWFGQASAWDAGDNASVPVTCVPESGSTFPLGVTTVACSASDSSGNVATGSFTVTVLSPDTTPPVFQGIPASPVVLEPENPTGAYYWFYVYATDNWDGSDPVVCSQQPGLFPIGTTTVECSATDSWGNSSSGSFTVTVLQPRVVTVTFTGGTVDPKSGLATISGTIQSTRDGEFLPGEIILNGAVSQRIGRLIVTQQFGSFGTPVSYSGGGPMAWTFTTVGGNGLLVAGKADVFITTYGQGTFTTNHTASIKLTPQH
jgi:hypothetical protein